MLEGIIAEKVMEHLESNKIVKDSKNDFGWFLTSLLDFFYYNQMLKQKKVCRCPRFRPSIGVR